jgi:hypothetical protein
MLSAEHEESVLEVLELVASPEGNGEGEGHGEGHGEDYGEDHGEEGLGEGEEGDERDRGAAGVGSPIAGAFHTLASRSQLYADAKAALDEKVLTLRTLQACFAHQKTSVEARDASSGPTSSHRFRPVFFECRHIASFRHSAFQAKGHDQVGRFVELLDVRSNRGRTPLASGTAGADASGSVVAGHPVSVPPKRGSSYR